MQRLVVPMMGGTTDEAVVEAAAATTASHLDVAESTLTRPWLAGPDFSQADIMAGVMIDLIALTPEGAALVAARPAVSAWLARLRARPSFATTFPEMLAAHRRP